MPTPTTPDWVKDAVFYQVFPDRFARSERVPKPPGLEPWGAPPTFHGYQGGDLWGVVEHLDHLGELGITALYLNPVFASASNHRYHTHDYLSVDPMLGGDEALRGLLDAAHARGMKVVLDGVFNHASRGFLPFNDLLENGPESPWAEWFTIRSWPLNAYDEGAPPGYDCWWGLHALPKLNTDHPQVREFIMGVAEHWLRFGIDGWRLDVPGEITTPGFWQEFRRRVKAVDPEAYICGEIWVDASQWLQGDQFDGVMNYEITGPTIAFTAGARVDPDFGAGRSYAIAPPQRADAWIHSIRDVLSRHPREVTMAQLNLLSSHDTARLLTIADGDTASVRLATLAMMTLPGAPCVYYGDEVGLPGGIDPDCRRAFPWHAPETWDRGLLDVHRELIALRRRYRSLRRGTWRAVTADDAVAVYARQHEGEMVVVALNTADEQRRLRVPGSLPGTRVWGEGSAVPTGDALELTVPPRTGLVLAS